jgi:pimeloyl-ACP methyl ester carboxylesterase
MGSISANDTTLYYERRGSGPSLVFISGATGDAGHWAAVADVLADDYTVITYDRRGNSRSPRPPGWTCTTVDEQADDTSALIEGLGLAPAIVFGSSAGANTAINLATRHPEVLRGAGVHEPLLLSGVADAPSIRARRVALVELATDEPSTRAATEAFLLSVTDKQTYDSLDRELRERLLGNGDILLTIETLPYLEYEPTPSDLDSVRLPCLVTAGVDNRSPTAPGHWRYQAATVLAAELRTPLVELPGSHLAYLAQPVMFAEALRPLLNGLV